VDFKKIARNLIDNAKQNGFRGREAEGSFAKFVNKHCRKKAEKWPAKDLAAARQFNCYNLKQRRAPPADYAFIF